MLPHVTDCSYPGFQPGLNVTFLSIVVFERDDSMIIGRKN